jgi:hypothetical protein
MPDGFQSDYGDGRWVKIPPKHRLRRSFTIGVLAVFFCFLLCALAAALSILPLVVLGIWLL